MFFSQVLLSAIISSLPTNGINLVIVFISSVFFGCFSGNFFNALMHDDNLSAYNIVIIAILYFFSIFSIPLGLQLTGSL